MRGTVEKARKGSLHRDLQPPSSKAQLLWRDGLRQIGSIKRRYSAQVLTSSGRPSYQNFHVAGRQEM